MNIKGLSKLFPKKEQLDTKKKEETTAKGVHIITVCNITSIGAKDLQNKIEQVAEKRKKVLLWDDEPLRSAELLSLWTQYRYLLSDLHRLYKKREGYVENVTVTIGRSVLAQRLASVNTYSGNVSHTAIGTDNSAPTIGDVKLGSESYRKALSSGTYLNNVAYLETFYSATEVSGSFEEYGKFIDGSAAADSGQLFNRFTKSESKSLLESLNVNSEITLNDA